MSDRTAEDFAIVGGRYLACPVEGCAWETTIGCREAGDNLGSLLGAARRHLATHGTCQSGQTESWRCPNDPPCIHPGFVHDIYEPGDPYPTCTMVGCGCGHPGEIPRIFRYDDGTTYVLGGDPVIRVARSLLDETKNEHWDAEAEILTLDSDANYRYRYLRPDPHHEESLIFGRIRDEAP